MIVGNGLLATAFARFRENPDVTIFASGVSNSQEGRGSEFARERELLALALARDTRLIYFSSCGVANRAEPPTAYMRHKQAMEAMVGARERNLVLRLPQVVGRTDNPHTLTNYLRDRIIGRIPFSVWQHAERNLVDIDDIVAVANGLLHSNHEVPAVVAIAAERSLPMPELVALFERVLGARGIFSVEPSGSAMHIHPRLPTHYAVAAGVDFGDGYAERVLRKYYEPSSGRN